MEPAEASLVQLDQGVSRGVRASHALHLHSLAIISRLVIDIESKLFLSHLGHPVELGEELGADGERVTAAEGEHLPGVPEAGAHHDGLVAVLLVVAEDLADTLDPGVLLGILIGLPGLGLRKSASIRLNFVAMRCISYLVIVHNSSDEWRNQGDLSLGACNCLKMRQPWKLQSQIFSFILT